MTSSFNPPKNISDDDMRQGFYDASKTLETTLSSANENTIKVLLLGLTGGGKTTLLHSLAGKRLHVKRHIGKGLDGKDLDCGLVVDVDDSNQLFSKDGIKPYGISHSFVSETYTPNVWTLNDDVLLFDCPGFYDTDIRKRLVNAFAVDKILEGPGKVKILWVVSEGQLDGKATSASNAFQMLCKMFPNQDQLKQCLGVVLTKTSEKCTANKLKALAQSGERGDVLSFLIASEDRVFTFPKAKSEGEYEFAERKKLLQFLTVDPVSQPQHQVALDSDAIMEAERITDEFNKEKKKVFAEFYELFEATIKECETPSELEKWRGYAQSLSKAAQDGFKDFYSCSQTLTPFKSCSDKLTSLLSWDEFLSMIIDCSPDLKEYGDDMVTMIEDLVKRLQSFHDRLRDRIEIEEQKRTLEERNGDKTESEKEPRFCPKKHLLVAITGKELIKYPKFMGALCDGCGHSVDDDMNVLFCATCHFVLCSSCWDMDFVNCGKCLNGHRLRQALLAKTGENVIYACCDGCGRTISTTDPVRHCDTCEFDLCKSCWGTFDPSKCGHCSEGHVLRQVCTAKVREFEYIYCDGCGREIAKNEVTRRCETCNYDLCASCWDEVDPVNCGHCHKNHPLRQVALAAFNNKKIYCDGCGTFIKHREAARFCKKCGTFYCRSCWDKADTVYGKTPRDCLLQ